MSRNLLRSVSLWAALGALACQAPAWAADPVSVLFVGNSYTFGRLDPVLTYNAANVTDLTRPQGALKFDNSGLPFTNLTGTNSYPVTIPPTMLPATATLPIREAPSFSPHFHTPGSSLGAWGGVPGIFKQMTVQAGLNYDVSLSTRNAASLRGHFLNTANDNWDMRGNIDNKKWNMVVLQDQSDEALGPRTVDGVALGSNYPAVRAYVDLIEDWVHTGTPIQAGVMTNNLNDTTYRERNMYYLGGTGAAGGAGGQYLNEAACVAAGGTPTVAGVSGSCANNALRTIPNNANFSAATEIYLQQTWARPNLINPPGTNPLPDPRTGNAVYTSTQAPSYFNSLEAMTDEMTTAMSNVAAYAGADNSGGITGIVPVGQAFMRAVAKRVATRDMYEIDAATDGLIDLWFNDGTHASVHGSYLSALTLFGSLTGLDPASLGVNNFAAEYGALGISAADALKLQRVASDQLGFAAPIPEPGTWAMMLAGLLFCGVRGYRNRPMR